MDVPTQRHEDVQCPVPCVGGWVEALTTLLGFMTNSPEGETGRQPQVPGKTLSFPHGAASNRWQWGFNLKILKHCVSSKPRQLQFYCLHSQKKKMRVRLILCPSGEKRYFSWIYIDAEFIRINIATKCCTTCQDIIKCRQFYIKYQLNLGGFKASLKCG